MADLDTTIAFCAELGLAALGVRKLMVAVTDIHAAIGRLRPYGAELVGGVVNYQDVHLLCYRHGLRASEWLSSARWGVFPRIQKP